MEAWEQYRGRQRIVYLNAKGIQQALPRSAKTGVYGIVAVVVKKDFKYVPLTAGCFTESTMTCTRRGPNPINQCKRPGRHSHNVAVLG